MTREGDLVVDGTVVRFERGASESLRVIAGDTDVGSITPAADGGGYTARGWDGEPLTRPSQWGGRITATFGSKELAVRALLSISGP